MSHALEELANGDTAFVSAREVAWHNLGTVLPGNFDAAQAMEYAHLGNWNVRKVELTAPVLTDDGVTVLDVAGKYATVRDNPISRKPEVLGVVGASYQPVQNEEHAEILDALVDESGAHFETAGSLYGGKQIFMTIKIPTTMQIGGVDPVDLYILARNSHDGSTRFHLDATPIRVVCKNTQDAAISAAKATYGVRHTRSARERIEAQAREALGLTFKYAEAFQAAGTRMLETPLTEANFVEAMNVLWTPPKASDTDQSKRSHARRQLQLVQLFTGSETIAPALRGTRWAGYQALTEYMDFYTPTAKTGAAAQRVRAERAVGSNGVSIKRDGWKLLSV